MKQHNIYYIGGPYGGIAEYKANTRVNPDGTIRGIYYSAIADSHAATLYFKDRRTAKNCLKKLNLTETFEPNYCSRPNQLQRIKKVKRLHSEDLYEIKRGYYISKNTYMYNNLESPAY